MEDEGGYSGIFYVMLVIGHNRSGRILCSSSRKFGRHQMKHRVLQWLVILVVILEAILVGWCVAQA